MEKSLNPEETITDRPAKKAIRNFTVKNLVKALVASASVTLMFCLFTPLDIFLNNQRDFALGFKEVSGYLIPPALTVFAGLLLFLLLILLLSQKIFDTILALLAGVQVTFYIQILFMNGKMIEGADSSNVGKISDLAVTMNGIFHFETILVPPVLVLFKGNITLKRKKKDEDKEDDKSKSAAPAAKTEERNFFIENIGVIFFAAISLMQFSGFISSYIKNDPKNYIDEEHLDFTKAKVFDIEPTVSFSKDNNIVVFLVDRFDSFWCDNLLEDYPELKDELEGFTFYQNNVSHYTHTFPSISSMLTNNVYDGSEWYEYLSKVWQGENAISKLKDNGYTVNFIIDNASTFKSFYQVEPYCDNIRVLEDAKIRVNTTTLRSLMYKLSLVRMLPYFLKDSFTSMNVELSSRSYIEFDDELEYFYGTVSVLSDNRLYQYTRQAPFNADSEKKVFTFMHLNGAHDDNDELIEESHIEYRENSTSELIRASFETIFAYMNSAKKLGVYDNTTYIILGDHGVNPEKLTDKDYNLVAPDVTALLVKPANAERAPLKSDRYTPLSNDMFSASILEYASLDHSDYGCSYNDIISGGIDVSRKFETFRWRGVGVVDPAEEFVINGDARDFSNWKKINSLD